ncbi:hypothetical protein KI387_026133, partial [Taxus chinensis]
MYPPKAEQEVKSATPLYPPSYQYAPQITTGYPLPPQNPTAPPYAEHNMYSSSSRFILSRGWVILILLALSGPLDSATAAKIFPI